MLERQRSQASSAADLNKAAAGAYSTYIDRILTLEHNMSEREQKAIEANKDPKAVPPKTTTP